LPGFKLPPLMFTDDEALALSVGLLAARGLGLTEAAPAVASAQAKLERVMPAPLMRRLRAVEETVQLELSRRAEPTNQAVLAALSLAAQRHLRVRFTYAESPAPRELDPYGLAYRQGRWYAVGHCHLRGEVRSFRLDRIRAVAALDVSFAAPPGFDALAHLTHAVATLPRAFAAEVLLETDLEAARRSVFPALGVLEQRKGGVLLRAQVDDLEWLAIELARLPFGFEVLRPAALRAALRTVARRLLERAGPG
jgi:predicted DNA-binding transcriptional regulator YafY